MTRLFCLFLLWLPALVWAQTPIALSAKPTNTLFALSVVDAKTGARLAATVRVHAYLAKKDYAGAATPAQDFEFVMTRADSILVQATAKGYETGEFVMVAPCDTCTHYGYPVQIGRAHV